MVSIPSVLFRKLKQYKFYRHGNYRDPFLFSYLFFCGLTKKNFQKSEIKYYLNPLVGINADYYVDERNAKQLTESYYKNIVKDSEFLDRYYDKHLTDYKSILRCAKDIVRRDYRGASNKELLDFIKKWFDINVRNIHWLWSMEFINTAVDRRVKEIISKYKGDADKLLFILGEPSEDLDAIIAKQDYLRHAVRIQTGKQDIHQASLELQSKYGWLGFNTWAGEPLGAAFFKNILRKLVSGNPAKQLENISKEKQRAKKEYKKVLEYFNKPDRETLMQVSRLVYLKSARIEMLSQSIWHLYDFINEVSNRIGVSNNDFLFLKPEEIYSALRGKNSINNKIIQKRKKDFALVRSDENINDFYGYEVEVLRQCIQPEIQITDILKGNIAYSGKVNGIVKVVNNETEINKIEKDDILVAPMTNPNYDPVLGKVAAMIADEGGILTHTAIVAREFKIPTIIGTKIATQVLKDGDFVEVDANKGIVKILKRK